MRRGFTPEELAEMAEADKEIDANFLITEAEEKEADERDRKSVLENGGEQKLKKWEYQRRYTKEKQKEISIKKRDYREKHKAEIKEKRHSFYLANKQRILAAQKEYRMNKAKLNRG